MPYKRSSECCCVEHSVNNHLIISIVITRNSHHSIWIHFRHFKKKFPTSSLPNLHQLFYLPVEIIEVDFVFLPRSYRVQVIGVHLREVSALFSSHYFSDGTLFRLHSFARLSRVVPDNVSLKWTMVAIVMRRVRVHAPRTYSRTPTPPYASRFLRNSTCVAMRGGGGGGGSPPRRAVWRNTSFTLSSPILLSVSTMRLVYDLARSSRPCVVELCRFDCSSASIMTM